MIKADAGSMGGPVAPSLMLLDTVSRHVMAGTGGLLRYAVGWRVRFVRFGDG